MVDVGYCRRHSAFDVKKECFLSDTLSSSLHGLQPAALVRQDDCIYIGTEEGVYIYTLSNGILEKLVDMPAGIRVHAILCQMFNRIWLATEGDGLYLYDMKTKELKNYRYEDGKSGLNSNYVRSLALDTENRLWVGTYGGLNIYKEDQTVSRPLKALRFRKEVYRRIRSGVFSEIRRVACGWVLTGEG